VSEARIVEAGVERVPELEPLWAALHDHHGSIAEAVAPTRELADSWERRRAQYERWLAAADARLLIAERSGTAIGYAVVRIEPGPATWDVGERVAELETLAVLAEARGAGVGRLLVAAARELARSAGAAHGGRGGSRERRCAALLCPRRLRPFLRTAARPSRRAGLSATVSTTPGRRANLQPNGCK
jgi:GNAT superfamily N-acetyltransferase